jgi:hypothetical protein
MENEQDRVNVYSVVLDCSAPYFMDKTNKYLCTIKLIDETVYPGLADKDLLSATFFAKEQKDFPAVSKIGSIIRIHRGQTKKFKEKLQLNCDVNIKGAWSLFDPTEGSIAVAHTGKSYTFTASDKERLKMLRGFTRKFFTKNEVSGITLQEAAHAKPKDFDSICLVLDTKARAAEDGKSMIRLTLCDSTKVVKLEIPPGKYAHIAPLDVVRLRSANYVEDGTYARLTLSEYSNVLRVPPIYKSAKVLWDALEHDNIDSEVKAQVWLHVPRINQLINPCRILHQHGLHKFTPLKELFADPREGKFYKVRLSAIEVGPQNVEDWLWAMDKKRQKQ